MSSTKTEKLADANELLRQTDQVCANNFSPYGEMTDSWEGTQSWNTMCFWIAAPLMLRAGQTLQGIEGSWRAVFPCRLTVCRTISRNYTLFDGFVVLHGTDSLAYTCSALSFMLQNLGKPVIFTGSQVPMSQRKNDAVENLLGELPAFSYDYGPTLIALRCIGHCRPFHDSRSVSLL